MRALVALALAIVLAVDCGGGGSGGTSPVRATPAVTGGTGASATPGADYGY